MSDLDSIRTIVQRNCDISDARHARDYTMCIYLLKMREYFRWEKGYALTDKLPSGDLGTWVEERESLWRQMGEREFDCLPVGNRCVDPYDTDAVNEHLLPRGYAYSAGLGRFVKPHFFLGRLVDQRTLNGFRVLITEDELARDLSAPPAMLRKRPSTCDATACAGCSGSGWRNGAGESRRTMRWAAVYAVTNSTPIPCWPWSG